MYINDKEWQVQQPGTILRARHSPHDGKLALVLSKSYAGRMPENGYPPYRYVNMQWCSTGERFTELLINANNCFDIVSCVE